MLFRYLHWRSSISARVSALTLSIAAGLAPLLSTVIFSGKSCRLMVSDSPVPLLTVMCKGSTNPRESMRGFSQQFWYAQVPRQQCLNGFNGIGSGQLTQDPTQPGIGLHSIGLGRLYQGIDDCAGVCPGRCVTEQPGFPAYNEGANRIFTAVIVNRQITAFGVARKWLMYAKAVPRALLGVTCSRVL